MLGHSPASGTPRPARAAAPRPHQPCRLPTSRQRRAGHSSTQRLTCGATRQLATYDLLSTRSLSTTWFQSCVQKLIGQLGSAPFLHVVHTLPLQQEETIVLSEDVLKSPQAWTAMSTSLAAADPDALVFVHSVNCAEDACPARKAAGRQACGSAADCASSMGAASACDILAGHVGDCCHPADAAAAGGNAHAASLALAPLWPGRAQQQQQQQAAPAASQPPRPHRHGGAAGGSAAAEQLEQYHGVVVQSPVFRDIEGCYLLKTTTAADRTGCRCTHFTLTKVCAGVPLLTQLQQSWLVGPQGQGP